MDSRLYKRPNTDAYPVHISESQHHVRLIFGFPCSGNQPDPLFSRLRDPWEAAGLDVVHVALDPGASADRLNQQYLEAVQAQGSIPLLLGGFSLGARIAAQAAHKLQPPALLCLGYPFHLRGEPGNRPGLETLRELHTPTLILQGTRDAHGNREEVRGYLPLPSCVSIHWLDDANHRFKPRARSGYSETEHPAEAAGAVLDFIVSVTGDSPDA